MGHVFISYARDDHASVSKLASAIERLGLNVWMDQRLAPGEHFDVAIEKALVAADKVLVAWSPSSYASRWVRAEAGEGLERGILVPVIIKPTAIPIEFKRVNAIDLSAWDGKTADEGIQRLFAALSGESRGTEKLRGHSVVPADPGGNDDPLLRLAVGKRAEFYLHAWKDMERRASGLSWNWAAFLSGLDALGVWPAYRKMWGWAFVMFVIGFVIHVIDLLFVRPKLNEATGAIVSILFWLAVAGLFGLLGNALYRFHVTGLVGEARLSTDAQRRVVARGGVSMLGLTAFAVATAFVQIIELLRDERRDELSRPNYLIGVTAASGGDQGRSQDMAQTIATDLGRYRSGPMGGLAFLAAGQNMEKASYRVEVRVAEYGQTLRADVSLLSAKDSRILWATTQRGPAEKFVEVRQRAVAMLGDVLSCAVAVTSRGYEVEPRVLSLFINGCGRMSDLVLDIPDQETINIFGQVTEAAPKFGAGWAWLALSEAKFMPATPPADRPALRKSALEHLAKAKKLDPTLPQTVVTDALLPPGDKTNPSYALSLLDRGLQRYPGSATFHSTRSLFLRDLGRMDEAVTAAQRAIGLNPLSPVIRDAQISALAYSGRTRAAYEALAEADSIWPGSTVLQQARYRLDLHYGDPKAFLRDLKQGGSGNPSPEKIDIAEEAFLEARIAPDQANIRKALEELRVRYRGTEVGTSGYLLALGSFGRVDKAYETMTSPLVFQNLLLSTETLFRPEMKSLRADRRFIALSAKLGLLAYWQKTAIWPDFCTDPHLPYDCRAEAAKLTSVQRLPMKDLN